VIVVLAGGTGGAKLARGLLDVVEAERLTVIANTGDDVEVYGVHVSPDPDLVTYWLADLIDEQRGYGIRGDSWETMAALESAGRDPWFRLGDRDLATCLLRTELLRAGERLTAATERIVRGLGVRATVVPMSDDPVRTQIASRGRKLPLQEFMIVEHAAAPIDGVELLGADSARAAPEALAAIDSAEAIVLGPSNPVISIGPILAVAEIREAIAGASAPVVAVSPFVGGRSVKGPTEAFCEHAGLPLGTAGVVQAYRGLVDGVVSDQPLDGAEIAQLGTDTLMATPARRRELARTTLEFAATLSGANAPQTRAR
jgi:LPPG:FO 2-phospho-L-lactate transferase